LARAFGWVAQTKRSGVRRMPETEDLAKYSDQRKSPYPDIFFILFCAYIHFSLCCMKVGFTPLKGILLSAMMGFFYLLFFRQLSLDSFFCRL